MANVREAILSAILEADRLHREFATEARAAQGEARIDVFDMLLKRDIPVMFRPLDSLLGAYIDTPEQGVLVTTQRPLPVQRFTAAHELGHAALGHEGSLDGAEVLARSPFIGQADYDVREIQANAFASELLTPPWLIARHMVQQGWKRENLTNASTVYQLALRIGSSYTATCHALAKHGVIPKNVATSLLDSRPKSIKQSLLPFHKPPTWHSDVWLITERDNGVILEGSRNDLVVFKIKEHASSGYVWEFGDLADVGFVVVSDGRESTTDESHIGGIVFRTLITESKGSASGHLHFTEIRQWQPDCRPLHSLDLDFDLSGPITAGLLLGQRTALLRSA